MCVCVCVCVCVCMCVRVCLVCVARAGCLYGLCSPRVQMYECYVDSCLLTPFLSVRVCRVDFIDLYVYLSMHAAGG